MKNHRSWHALTRPSGEGDWRPNALIRPLVEECTVFKLCMALCKGGIQTVYDFAEKTDLVYDLIEKIRPENDLVYDLTEIDTRGEFEEYQSVARVRGRAIIEALSKNVPVVSMF